TIGCAASAADTTAETRSELTAAAEVVLIVVSSSREKGPPAYAFSPPRGRPPVPPQRNIETPRKDCTARPRCRSPNIHDFARRRCPSAFSQPSGGRSKN